MNLLGELVEKMSQSANENEFKGCGRLTVLAGAIVVATGLTILFEKSRSKTLEGRVLEIQSLGKPNTYKVLWENSTLGKRWYNLELKKVYKKGDSLEVLEKMYYEPFRTQKSDNK